ncbi:MAG: DNA primase [Proteobacteria bacterium]|nr:DNA primase [Pseudomonadota bacterium]MBU4383528.1 DNA primase [Pseudomonadota bacterium]MCG2764453.1 DNA primase [Desulfarculaceae bacterium]
MNDGGRIPEHKIDEVRNAANIAEVIGRRVKLSTAGRTLKGLCPFHGDTDPSFIVNRERGTWHCFGCGEGGNVFTFLMKDEGLTFPEAVKRLAEQYGVHLPTPERTPEQKRQDQHRGRLLRVMELAGNFFVQQLAAPSGEPARRYLLEQRGLRPQVIKDFGLGWAPDAWEGLRRFLGSQGVPEALAIESGMLVARDKGDGCYDRFRGRVMFPIADVSGRMVSFGGRVLGGGEPKYLNGPETLLFKKSATLYNLERARPFMRKKDRALVVEGYFDVITLAAMGFGETVAPMGTALTPQQVRRLKGQASRLVLVFDGDQAGVRAARRSLPLCLAEGVQPEVLLLPTGEDPDSFARSQGAEGLEEAIEASGSLIEAVLDQIIAEGDQGTPEGKSKIVAEAGGVIKAIGDPVSSWLYLSRLAARLGLPAEVAAARLGLPVPGGRRPSAPLPAPAPRQNGGVGRQWQEAVLQLAMSEASAAQVLAREGALAALVAPDLVAVAQAVEHIVEQGGVPDASAVISRLDDPELHRLVSRLAQDGPILTPEQAAGEAQALCAKIRRWQMRQRNRELTSQIVEAQSRGDSEQVTRLQDQRRREIDSVSSFESSRKD